MPDPSRIASPDARQLSRLLVDLQNRVDRLERGGRTTQLPQSSIHDGALAIYDGDGNERVRVGRQPDGRFGWGQANADAPPRPNTPEVVPTLAGFNVKWNGEFAGVAPSDFTYTVVYASPAGASFTIDDSLVVGRLLGAGVIPVTAINGTSIDPTLSYWVRLVSYNASHVPSTASFTVGPVTAGLLESEDMADDSVTEDKIAVAAVVARHIRAGEITADKLEAILILASQIIAGDPAGWHLMLGNPTTPILYWDGETTGFAVAQDPITGAANCYVQGRLEFGSGSQIEQDYIDLAEQGASGFQAPKLRQARTLIYSAPNVNPSSATAGVPWLQATGVGNLLLCSVLAEGSSLPTLTVPATWTLVTTTTSGTTRMSLYYIANAATSHTKEVITASAASSWSFGLYEYSGIATASTLDVFTSSSGTGTTASTGTTATTAQANELQLAVFGSPGAATSGTSRLTAPTDGFATISQGGSASHGQGSMAAAKIVSAIGTTSCSATVATSQQWLAIVATFRSAAAAGQPPTPAATTARMFCRPRSGYSIPHVIDNTGDVYPLGRVPYARVRLTTSPLLTAATNTYAQADWAVIDDPFGMVAISTSGGTFSNITIPVDGMYWVSFRALFQASTNTGDAVVAFVTKNARDPAVSIARDGRKFTNLGGDGSSVHAQRVVPLVATDVLYWANFTSVNASLAAIFNNVPTEMAVHYLGPIA